MRAVRHAAAMAKNSSRSQISLYRVADITHLGMVIGSVAQRIVHDSEVW